MNHVCANCHFFMMDLIAPGQSMPYAISEEQRNNARNGDFRWVKEHHALRCYFGVWDAGYRFESDKLNETICDMNRKDFCFFFQDRPGMLFPAAKVLQEREAAYRETAKDRRLIIWGLWIAAGALAVNAVLAIWERICE